MIKKKKIKVIKLNKGNIVKFFDFNKSPLKKYSEIYFSEVKKNKFKGWKYHENRSQVMTISSGSVMFAFKKKINGKQKKIKMSYPNNLYWIYIPKKLFYSFKCLSKRNSIIINLIDERIK